MVCSWTGEGSGLPQAGGQQRRDASALFAFAGASKCSHVCPQKSRQNRTLSLLPAKKAVSGVRSSQSHAKRAPAWQNTRSRPLAQEVGSVLLSTGIEGLQRTAAPLKKTSADMARFERAGTLCSRHPRSSYVGPHACLCSPTALQLCPSSF